MAKNAKVSPSERKQKRETAQKIMEVNGVNYNDWLHDKHVDYILNNADKVADSLQQQSSSNNDRRETADSHPRNSNMDTNNDAPQDRV